MRQTGSNSGLRFEREKMGSEPSEKTASDGLNLNVKTLLSTGLLEGISVRYIHHGRNKELPGIIKGVDYCCGCTECNFNQVFSARKFEAHAGSKSSHSNNHIFLKNGKSLHNVVKKLGDLSLESIGEVIEGVIGERPNFECYEAWKDEALESV
ncbi:hypothetical protein QJS10_CPB20g00987 [Acorus calamus]|uniref:Tify domain-containing protein n=1 Tax=Acorus calamus TaxID=4465 RepID=A0AAV9CD10_ACOCL|nr:hypothetical protein QJS10_CPB20g00987 [Acorus calamus]